MFILSHPEPTKTLDLADLRIPNRFDMALLEEEGVRYGRVVIRGAKCTPGESPRTPPPVPARRR